MTSGLLISEKAQRLVKRCGTRNPFKICREANIHVYVTELGSLKGMYSYIKRNRWAFLNENLSEQMTRIVLAHEIGHDQLHRELAKGQMLQEFTMFSMTSVTEYEANIFAAEILLPDEDMLELCYAGYSNIQIAARLESDANLVGIKLDVLRRRGVDLLPVEHQHNFLK